MLQSTVDWSVRDIRWQIAAEWLEIAQRSQWKDYRKPLSLFWKVPSLTSYDLPFSQTGCPKYPIQVMSSFVKSLWLLFLLNS